RERGRLVRLEDVTRESAREQVVVDSEQHVAFGVPCREKRTRHELASVARLQDLEREAAFLLERLLHVGRDRERVVRDEDDFARPTTAAAASGREGSARDEQAERRAHYAPSP